MAFDSLSEKLQNVFKNLRSKGRLTEADVKAALKEVKMALLEADVNFKVVKQFVKSVQERAIGADVMNGLNPGQMVIKIVNEEMIKMMGHSGTVPGSISAQDVPDALSKLTSALSAKNAAEENLPTDVDVDEEEEQVEPAVSLGRRAFPLIELLKSAIKEECEVMWDNQ